MTIFKDPYSSIYCQYGNVSVKYWLEREAARIMRQAGRVAEIRESYGRVALYVNDPRPGRIRK